ncbi:ATP-binding cassette sub-family A member 3 [Brachionus plicatilis]|uniref:ATP-binding cassette sub-family A member 3 n=1 Tax=Brachionus plicatilis TaxID=10195 RepID=A0A3M7PSS2_BRAPC|nr:ATP-binding cassette sub-family A member 3 [Brachionus plicatilis]
MKNKTLRYKNDLVKLFSGLYDTNLNIGLVIISMIIWTLMLIPFIWYFEKVVPSQFGIPLPFYFLFQPSYWSNLFQYKKLDDLTRSNDFVLNNKDGSESTVAFRDVTKVQKFQRGSKKKSVINNLNLDFYENEVIMELEKKKKTTTTLFILCGIYSPSSGDVLIYNQNLRNNLDKVRRLIGFCPQIPILFDDLTVYEHLKLIATIKDYPQTEIEIEIHKIAAFLNLEEYISKRAKNLSGGTKKRLSIAMALIGDPKIIILDEPSSGIDSKNRRQLWNIIQKFKLNKTIIISTHYLQEADYLSDKIGILNKGSLKCYGNPKYLKSNFCQGYKLVVKKSENFNEIVLRNIIELFDENYLIEANYHNEISLYVNISSSHEIYQFLKNIEDNNIYIGYESYSISSPTLEEVFLRMGKLEDETISNFNRNKPEIENHQITKINN